MAVILMDGWEISSRRMEHIGNIEALTCVRISPSFSVARILVYRPPDSPSCHLLQLCDIVAQLSPKYANLNVLGNFNVQVNDEKFSQALLLVETLEGLNLTHWVTAPTHTEGHMLGPIFSNNPDLKVEAPIRLTWTDHFLVSFSFWLESNWSNSRSISDRRRN